MSRFAGPFRSLRLALPPLVLLSWGLTFWDLGQVPAAQAEDAPAARQLYLDQGWTAEERQRFYFTSQGSQLIPYDWFLVLEAVDGSPFRSDANMHKLRFIPQPPGDRNPHGLPVGFVRDDNPADVFNIKRAFLGENLASEDYPRTNAWVGLTCAACHTVRIAMPTATLTIDGGPALADIQTFLESLTQSLQATHKEPARMDRFARAVLADNYNADEAAALKKRVAAYTSALEQVVARNASSVRYGHARLDAFGAILNEICATALQIPENRQPSDAPASFPFLWETPRLDWVQWNGSTNNPLTRNVGEALGVFAHFSLTGPDEADRFQSTVNLRNLFELEQLVDKLRAPAWPEEHLGRIDRQKAERGAKLFEQNCAKCHGVRGPDGQFPLTAPNAKGHRFINTTMVPLEEIGTDNRLALNFLRHAARPGPLKSLLPPPLAELPAVPRLILLRGRQEDHRSQVGGNQPATRRGTAGKAERVSRRKDANRKAPEKLQGPPSGGRLGHCAVLAQRIRSESLSTAPAGRPAHAKVRRRQSGVRCQARRFCHGFARGRV